MPSNSQIEKRLQEEYQSEIDNHLEFRTIVKRNSENKIDYRIDLCFIPEFRKGENYKFIDERNNFIPDNTYLKLKNECVSALKAISNENGRYILDREITENFFEQNLTLYYQVFHQWNYRAFHQFRHLFFYLIDWVNYFRMGKKAKNALLKLNPYNDDDIEDWLIDHNRLYYVNSIFWGPFFTIIDEYHHLYMFQNESFTAFIQGEELTQCIDFGEEYKNYEKKAFPRE